MVYTDIKRCKSDMIDIVSFYFSLSLSLYIYIYIVIENEIGSLDKTICFLLCKGMKLTVPLSVMDKYCSRQSYLTFWLCNQSRRRKTDLVLYPAYGGEMR